MLCDETTDRYQVAQGDQESLRFILRHDPTVGDLSLVLSDLNSGSELRSSNTAYGTERLELVQVGADRVVEITVRGQDGYDVPYELTIERLSADECAADSYEGLLGNDDSAHAASVTPGQVAHMICSDEDWFSIDLSAGVDVEITAFPSNGSDLVDTALYDSDLVQITQGAIEIVEGNPGDLQMSATIESTGLYFISVERNDPAVVSNPSTLEITTQLAGNVAELTCAESQLLTPAAPIDLSGALDLVRLPVDCGVGIGRTEVAHFDLAQPETVVLTLTGAMVSGALDIRSDCEDAATASTCSFSDEFNEQLTITTDAVALEAGRHYVVMEANAQGAVQLSLEIQ